MHCEDVREQIHDEPLEERVAIHLASCASCAEERRSVAYSMALLDSWVDVTPLPSFTHGVMQRVSANGLCAQVQDALVESNGEVGAALADHVSACEACSDEALLLRASWKALGAWSDIEPSSGLVLRVASEVSAPRVARRTVGGRVVQFWGRLAAVLAVVLGVYALTTAQPGGQSDVGVSATGDRGAYVAALPQTSEASAETRELLEDLQEPAPGHKTDEIIEELLTYSSRTSVR